MAEIEELLAKLKDLDPETYQILTKKIGDNVIIFEPWGEKIFGFILQGVIQAAIAARPRWGYSVDSLGDRAEECRFCGLVVGPVESDDLADGWIRAEDASTPAEALLQAYIAALEAEHGGE